MEEGTAHWVGIDLHQESLSVAVYVGSASEPLAEVRMPTQGPGLRKFLGRLDATVPVRAVYEASSCGYWLARQITTWGMKCEVAAPSLIPRRAGDRVKTDRRDARKLATLHRAGLLELVTIPTPPQEDIRLLVRTYESGRRDRNRSRQRVLKLLQARGVRFPGPGKNWSKAFWEWLQGVGLKGDAKESLDYHIGVLGLLEPMLGGLDEKVAQRATQEPFPSPVGRLRCLRGIDTLAAMSVVTEVFDMRRFASPRRFVGWVGLGVQEASSGNEVHHGHITRTGNARCRRILVEAAWNNIHPPKASNAVRSRWKGQPEAVVAKAMSAQKRLYGTWVRLSRRKDSRVVATAVARELAGYVWAMWLATPEALAMK